MLSYSPRHFLRKDIAPQTLTAIYDLGCHLLNQGKLADADRAFCRAYPGFESVYGWAHPMSIEFVASFMKCSQNLAKYEEVARLRALLPPEVQDDWLVRCLQVSYRPIETGSERDVSPRPRGSSFAELDSLDGSDLGTQKRKKPSVSSPRSEASTCSNSTDHVPEAFNDSASDMKKETSQMDFIEASDVKSRSGAEFKEMDDPGPTWPKRHTITWACVSRCHSLCVLIFNSDPT